MYCRMLQGEHSAILSTFIKLPLSLSLIHGHQRVTRHICLFVCLFVWFDSLCPSQQVFSYVVTGWTSTKQGLMCQAQGHNAVTWVRLKPPAPLSRIKHSTTEPLCSQKIGFKTNYRLMQVKLSLSLTWILCKNQKIPIGVRHATSGIFLIFCVWSRYDPQTAKQALKLQNDIWLPW